MALADLQRAMASLFTDELSRERFRSDPGAFARAFALTPAESAQLETLGATRLHAYVDTLDRKRAAEAARLLPFAATRLGPEFRRAFLVYARRAPLGSGHGRYVADALAFARTRPDDAVLAFAADMLAAATTPRARRFRAAWYRLPGRNTFVLWTPFRNAPFVIGTPMRAEGLAKSK